MHEHTLRELSQLLRSRDVSSTELTHSYLNRIHQIDPHLNSFITVCDDQALEQATAADLCLQKNTAGPLTGIPIAQKDIFCTLGVKTSCGSKMLDNFIAPYDAHTVQNFNQAGCVMLGKANMDEFAMGSSNESSYYGPAHNPWQLDCVPGGSSGGSAACVAARLAPFATGTDTGGSIRQPAAHCGITGLKPTYGRVSRYGMIAFASSLDQGGLMAPSAEDIAYALPIMAGHDSRDSTSSTEPVPDYLAGIDKPIEGLKIGLPEEYFSSDLPQAMREKIEATQSELADQGATFHTVSLPHTEYASSAYYILAPAECSSNLSRFDGIRFGHRSDTYETLEELYKKSRSEGFGPEVKRRILTGTYTLSAGYYDAYYRKAQQARYLIRQDFFNVFQTVDCLLTPVTPTPAFKLGEKTFDPIAMYLSDIYTIAVNLAGLPSLSMPAGFIEGLPVGAQLIGPHFSETLLLQVAHQYQQHSHWHQHIPPLAQAEQPLSESGHQ